MKHLLTLLTLTLASLASAGDYTRIIAAKKAADGGGGGGGAVTGAYEAFYETGAFATGDTTFSSCDLGTAAADRRVYLVVTHREGEFSGITINGESATEHAGSESTGLEFNARIFSAAVPTGATGDVVLTASTAGNWITIATYSVSGASATPHDTLTVNNGTTLSGSLDTLDDGFVIAAASQNSNDSHTWTAPMVEDFDDTTSADTDKASGASFSVTTGATETIEVVLNSSGADFTALVAISITGD